MKDQTNAQKKPMDVVAAILFGMGLGMGFIPILIASLMVKRNLMLECFNRMNDFWRSRGW